MEHQEKPVLSFAQNCQVGSLIRREKRFSVLVELDGCEVWTHTNNTGSMMGLLRRGAPVLISPALKPGRKLAWTLEAVKIGFTARDIWIGVNTSVPNRFLEAAFRLSLFPWLAGYNRIQREAVYGESRIDALFLSDSRKPLWVECKNVSMVEDERASFPDAVSLRGRKHLADLGRLVEEQNSAAMLYVVQRSDAHCFGPADFIDPDYAISLRQALARGVHAYAVRTRITAEGIFYDGMLDIKFDDD